MYCEKIKEGHPPEKKMKQTKLCFGSCSSSATSSHIDRKYPYRIVNTLQNADCKFLM